MLFKNLIHKLCISKSAGIFPKTLVSPPNLPFDLEQATGALQYHMTNDLLVKLLLERNENVLKSLLSALLHIPIESITQLQILNPFIQGQTIESKTTVLDIHLVINNDTSIDLEIQVVKEEFWKNRSILYLCRQYDRLKSGDDYSKLIPAIHIGILDFNLFPEDEPEFFSSYKLMNIKNYKIYSDKLQIYVLNLNQINYATEEDKAYNIDYWAKLFKATTWEDLKMLANEDPIFKEASETIYNITQEDSLRAYLLSREIYALDELTKKNREKALPEKVKTLEEMEKNFHEKEKDFHEKEKDFHEREKNFLEKEQKMQFDNNRLSCENEALSSELERLHALLVSHGISIK